MMRRLTSPGQASPRSQLFGAGVAGPPSPVLFPVVVLPHAGSLQGSISSSLGQSATAPVGAPVSSTQFFASPGSHRGPALECSVTPGDQLLGSLRSVSTNCGSAAPASLYARWRSALAADDGDGRRVSGDSISTTDTLLKTVPALNSVPSTSSTCVVHLPTASATGSSMTSPKSSDAVSAVVASASIGGSLSTAAEAVSPVTRRKSRALSGDMEGPAILRPMSADLQQIRGVCRLSREPSSAMLLNSTRGHSLERSSPTSRLIAAPPSVLSAAPRGLVPVQIQTRLGSNILEAPYGSSEASIRTVAPFAVRQMTPASCTTVIALLLY